MKESLEELFREEIFVDPKLQLKIAALPVTALLMAAVVLAINTWSYYHVIADPKTVTSALRQAVNELNTYHTVSLVLYALGMFVLSVHFGKTVVAPLRRLARVLERAGQGDFTLRVLSRRNEEFKDLLDCLNNAMSKAQAEKELDGAVRRRLEAELALRRLKAKGVCVSGSALKDLGR